MSQFGRLSAGRSTSTSAHRTNCRLALSAAAKIARGLHRCISANKPMVYLLRRGGTSGWTQDCSGTVFVAVSCPMAPKGRSQYSPRAIPSASKSHLRAYILKTVSCKTRCSTSRMSSFVVSTTNRSCPRPCVVRAHSRAVSLVADLLPLRNDTKRLLCRPSEATSTNGGLPAGRAGLHFKNRHLSIPSVLDESARRAPSPSETARSASIARVEMNAGAHTERAAHQITPVVLRTSTNQCARRSPRGGRIHRRPRS
ncbi:hypothetical protein C8R46DRAFT_284376 [Mycena filopes]|nr:hypothetical protein C8R46DRAFT_284376 [Mycena filopes]